VAPGQSIRVEMTKWGGRPHWTYAGVFLGTDGHGEWLGCPIGTHYHRPGMEFVSDFASVTLVPAEGAAHLATFNTEPAKSEIYVDMTTPAAWDGSVLHAIDLDLDVIKRPDGTIFVDDEDEFAEHQVAYGYPPDVVAMAERSAADVLSAVRASMPPYDGTADAWHARLGAA
jgi:hypothetical protein